ncbi:unnamed protein product [Lampetra planeri]
MVLVEVEEEEGNAMGPRARLLAQSRGGPSGTLQDAKRRSLSELFRRRARGIRSAADSQRSGGAPSVAAASRTRGAVGLS